MNKQMLFDMIQDFAAKKADAFDFEELAEYAAARVKGFYHDAEDRLWDLACRSDFLFEDDREHYSDRFMPRHAFFKGAEFRVKPLDEEVKGGYLVPGHRFMPFIERDVFPSEAGLKLPDGSMVPTCKIQLSVAEVDRFLLFFGQYGAVEYLLADDEENAQSLQPPYDGSVSVTVFDLKIFFDRCGFRAGDSLMLTVEDWLKGWLSLRHLPAKQEPLDFSETRDWTHALRLAFEEDCQTSELNHDCNEQMARMLWLAEANENSPAMLSNPPLSLAAFFNMQKDLTVQTAGQVSFFWPIDEPVESRMLNSMEEDIYAEAETELDAYFDLLGLSLSSDEAEAYMRDALARGERDSENALARVIQGRTLYFPTADDQQDFNRLWLELWEAVRTRYVPSKDPHRKMRAVFLDLNDQCLGVLRELDRNSPDPHAVLNNPATLQLGELSSMISSALLVCNQDDEDFEDFPLPLDAMARDLSAAIEELSQRLGAAGAKTARDAAAGPIYQLKISLKHTKPPIWRRVLVSSGIELEDLHGVIQEAFGWTNSHMHQFVVGRTCYLREADNDGFMPMFDEDSRGVRLDSILRKEKDKIDYEYDFGDSWMHQILLEKILPADSSQSLPVCIKGKRACPPEDCGGIYGYFHLLETLSGPDSDEKDELLDWIGVPIDPEAFDLDECNARLRVWCR